eukprot:561664-Rhodomonas_salina.4
MRCALLTYAVLKCACCASRLVPLLLRAVRVCCYALFGSELRYRATSCPVLSYALCCYQACLWSYMDRTGTPYAPTERWAMSVLELFHLATLDGKRHVPDQDSVQPDGDGTLEREKSSKEAGDKGGGEPVKGYCPSYCATRLLRHVRYCAAYLLLHVRYSATHSMRQHSLRHHGTVLRTRYAKSGTDCGYGATREEKGGCECLERALKGCRRWAGTAAPMPLCPYALPTPSPVLTMAISNTVVHMVLPAVWS